MSNFRDAFSNFIWERLNAALARDKEHKIMLDKIVYKGEAERLAIVDYGGVTAEVAYKIGLQDGLKMAMELGIAALEDD